MQEKNYKVTVTYEIIYEYYDDSNGSYMGENQQAQVVINSPFMPKRPMKPRKKAISQCSSTYSSSGTYQGPGEYKGKNAKYIKKEGLFLQEHNNKKARGKLKISDQIQQ